MKNSSLFFFWTQSSCNHNQWRSRQKHFSELKLHWMQSNADLSRTWALLSERIMKLFRGEDEAISKSPWNIFLYILSPGYLASQYIKVFFDTQSKTLSCLLRLHPSLFFYFHPLSFLLLYCFMSKKFGPVSPKKRQLLGFLYLNLLSLQKCRKESMECGDKAEIIIINV